MKLITQKTMVLLHLADLKERGIGLTEADKEYIKKYGEPDERETLFEQRRIFGLNHMNEEYFSELKAELLHHNPDDEAMIDLYKKAKRKRVNYQKLSEITGLPEQWFIINLKGDSSYVRIFGRLSKIKDPEERQARINNYIYVQHNRGLTINRIQTWCNYSTSRIKKIIKIEEQKHGSNI